VSEHVNIVYTTLAAFAQINSENKSKFIIMPIVTILVVIIVVGVLLWLINSFIPMDSKIKSILNVVVVIILIVWLLKVFGIFTSLMDIHV